MFMVDYNRTGYSRIIRYIHKKRTHNLTLCDSLMPCSSICRNCRFSLNGFFCERAIQVRGLVK